MPAEAHLHGRGLTLPLTYREPVLVEPPCPHCGGEGLVDRYVPVGTATPGHFRRESCICRFPWGTPSARRLCLCCGTPGANLLRLTDGRAYRACDDCLSRCEQCRRMCDGAKEREPMAKEERHVG